MPDLVLPLEIILFPSLGYLMLTVSSSLSQQPLVFALRIVREAVLPPTYQCLRVFVRHTKQYSQKE